MPEIKTFTTPNGAEWFNADDVCKALGYSNTKDALYSHIKTPTDKLSLNSLITEHNLEVPTGFRRNYEGQQPYISKDAVCLLVSKCKNVAAVSIMPELINQLNLNMRIIAYSKEQKHINSIIAVLKHERYKTQFRVETYKIDLYFIDKKIAIECDEHGHVDRSVSAEIARQKFIEDVLGCKFIRFNPDKKHFSILDVIGRIVRAMYLE